MRYTIVFTTQFPKDPKNTQPHTLTKEEKTMIQSKEQLERICFSLWQNAFLAIFSLLLNTWLDPWLDAANETICFQFIAKDARVWMQTQTIHMLATNHGWLPNNPPILTKIASQHWFTWATNIDTHGQLQNSSTFEPIFNNLHLGSKPRSNTLNGRLPIPHGAINNFDKCQLSLSRA